MKDKRPSFQFYPGDWMKDPALRSVSLSARGLWTDMLCLMFENDRRGYLQHVTGKPVTAEQLARMTGSSTDDVSRMLQELEDSGVFSRNEHGIIFSRRQVRDERKRELCSEAGKRGGGNPAFKGVSKGTPKGIPKQNTNPSSSASSSASSSNITPIAQTPAQVVNGIGDNGKQNIKPYNINSDIGFILAAYKMSLGVDFKDREWDRDNYKRFSKSAKELLIIFNQDKDQVVRCIDGISSWAVCKKLDWTLETVVKRASDWKIGRLNQ